ncbi:MAG: hypothetical protein OEV06_04955 [Anaerolineae bacterium]|nr:hypothetical protein [Anaerolineae bacterium]
MPKELPDNLNPYTRSKFEAISTYDPYESLITDLNQAFHHTYNHLIHQTHETLGQTGTPVIIIFGDKVMLFHDGQRETVEIIPGLYHRLKAISHVSFGVYITLAGNGYGPLSDHVRRELDHEQGLIRAALAILDQEPIPAEILPLQRATLENAGEIIHSVLERGSVDEDELAEFALQNAPLYLENAAHSAQLELDLLHETVMGWRESVGEEQWDSLYVVICAGHQARYRELTRQYFQKLFHEGEMQGVQDENRVIYAEHIYDVDAALDLLARHINDRGASLAFFGSRTRLQEDLMSDAAAGYLEKILGN